MTDSILAGERMRIEEDGDKTVITFDDVGTGRRCGSCSACCKLLPIRALAKPANQRCKHQSASKGCRIYPDRPLECRSWSCRWLADPSTAGMPRPDRAHYVIDALQDYITLRDPETGEGNRMGVFQVWVDPAFRSAYKSPELRAWMLRKAEEHGTATIVRWNSRGAICVFPPPLSADREWHEQGGKIEARNAHEGDILQNL